jgi:hypothetical protein
VRGEKQADLSAYLMLILDLMHGAPAIIEPKCATLQRCASICKYSRESEFATGE